MRRTGDDLQYLGRRRLLLAGFLQVFARIGDRRLLTRVAAGAMWRLVLVVLRPSAGLASRAFAPLVLLPVLDGRAISVPGSGRDIFLMGKTINSGKRISAESHVRPGQADFRLGFLRPGSSLIRGRSRCPSSARNP